MPGTRKLGKSTDQRMAMLREHGYVRLMKDRMRRAL